jgi:hypothetical protein
MQVTLYDNQGSMLQQIDFSNAADARDFTSAAFNPGGDVAVLGGFNCLTTCTFNAQAGLWEMAATKKVCQHCSSYEGNSGGHSAQAAFLTLSKVCCWLLSYRKSGGVHAAFVLLPRDVYDQQVMIKTPKVSATPPSLHSPACVQICLAQF